MTEHEELHAIFYGRVQGVFFRATARDIAKRMGIKGTVRNLQDGSVEIVAEATKEVLEEFVLLLSRNFYLDPSNPYKLQYREPRNHFETFSIVY